MQKPRDLCFILWADRFDEAAAAIFVSEFRSAGLKTSLVRAAGQSGTGANGLTLVPDMTIDEASMLADRAACVVIPCNTQAIQYLRTDPRVASFLAAALTSDVNLVVGERADQNFLWSGSSGLAKATLYSDHQSVLRLARHVALRLAADRARARPRRIRANLATPASL